jgi:hypothetical protein
MNSLISKRLEERNDFEISLRDRRTYKLMIIQKKEEGGIAIS